jgi:hypothetical protein
MHPRCYHVGLRGGLQMEGARPPLFGAYLRPSRHGFIRTGFRAFGPHPHVPRIGPRNRPSSVLRPYTIGGGLP